MTRLLRTLMGLSICKSTKADDDDADRRSGIDCEGHRQEHGHHQERLEAGRQAPDDTGGGPAVHREELLEMPEPLGGLEGPVGLEEPGDDVVYGSLSAPVSRQTC